MGIIRGFFYSLFLSFFMASPALAIVGAIQGPIPENHPASYNTISLVRKHGNNSTKILKIFCSGIILSDTYIMTAKHCLGERKISDFYVYFGDDTNQIDPHLLREAKTMSTYGPKDWQSYFPSLDFGWIELKSPIPNADGKNKNLPHFRPIPILADQSLLKGAKAIHLAGYGNQSTQLMEIIAGKKQHVAIGFKKYINTPQTSSLILLEGEEGHSNCHGDSGGPAYALITNPVTGSDQWYVFGTAAGFDLALTPNSYKEYDDDLFPNMAFCGQAQTLYTFIGDYVEWLKSTTKVSLSQLGNQRPFEPGIFKKSNLEGDNFISWCENTNFTDPQWLTVRQMIIFAMEDAKTEYSQEEIFLNCDKAEKALMTLNKLSFEEHHVFSSLEPLATVPSIEKVSFIKTAIPDVRPLAESQVIQLTVKNIGVSKFTDIPGLVTLSQLTELNLSQNKIKSMEPVLHFKNLTSIDVSRNQIQDISPVAQLSELRRLEFFNNDVADLSPLFELNRLEYLSAVGNELLSSAAPDGTWPYLKVAYLGNNNLEDIKFLRNAYALERLVISSNQIHSLEPIKDKSFKRLVTYGNPVSQPQPR